MQVSAGSGKQEQETELVEKSRTEADTHSGERRQADRKAPRPPSLTADVCAKAQPAVPCVQCAFKALGSIPPPSWDNPTPRSHEGPSHSIFRHMRHLIRVVQMCQKEFPLLQDILLKCSCSLKNNLNFQVMRTLGVHQLNCYQTLCWGAFGESEAKREGKTQTSDALSPSPLCSTRAIYYYLFDMHLYMSQ